MPPFLPPPGHNSGSIGFLGRCTPPEKMLPQGARGGGGVASCQMCILPVSILDVFAHLFFLGSRFEVSYSQVSFLDFNIGHCGAGSWDLKSKISGGPKE